MAFPLVNRDSGWPTEKMLYRMDHIEGPDENVAPDTSPKAENRDAIWASFGLRS
jgi:hypothetical protein